MRTTLLITICFILFLAGIITSVFGQTKTPTLPKKSPTQLLADSLYKIAEKYELARNYEQGLLFFEKSLKNYQIVGQQQGKRMRIYINNSTIYSVS